MRIAIIHYNLGIGGAEKLILLVAISLIEMGHQVTIYTTFYKKNRSFEESKNPKLAIKVIPLAEKIPLNIYGKFTVFLTLVKLIIVSVFVPLNSHDVFLVDIHPIPLSVLKAKNCLRCLSVNEKPRKRFFFYGHFPDRLLTKKRGFLHRLYRKLLDPIESRSIEFADKVVVNSEFTRNVFRDCFPGIATPQILYPVSVKSKKQNESSEIDLRKNWSFLVSINRFDKAKNLFLAIETLFLLRKRHFEESKNVKVVLAGGFSENNKLYFEELVRLTESKMDLKISHFPDLEGDVVFLRNFSEKQKQFLFKIARCLIYTPLNEHFGIAPIEAMQNRVPVIATNTGGLLETVVDRKTGFLCNQNAEDFAQAVLKIVKSDSLCEKMGIEGQKHVELKFSEERFKSELSKIFADEKLSSVKNFSKSLKIFVFSAFCLIFAFVVISIQ
ncbi:Alpha-1,3-mannosyltransferase-like protein [Bonamia ostreae]|uniref:Alpha-1,3/1,6-mannosyltransferase ALG2 n=1 Tax=Bonamia ostreae TaxID=126728 RepID=A0ABV2AEI6_9EUKA